MKKFSTLRFNLNTYHPNSSENEYSSYQSSSTNELVNAPERCVENILNFARSYSVAESKTTGMIEMVLN